MLKSEEVLVAITGDRRESKYDVTAGLDRNMYSQLTKWTWREPIVLELSINTSLRLIPSVGAIYLMTMSGNEQDQVASDPWRDRLCLISDQICFARSPSFLLVSAYITMLDRSTFNKHGPIPTAVSAQTPSSQIVYCQTRWEWGRWNLRAS